MPVEVKSNGELRLPKEVRKVLHLHHKRALVGFVIEGGQVRLSKAAVIPEPILSDEELAELARLSKRGVGKKTFRRSDEALRHLWSV